MYKSASYFPDSYPVNRNELNTPPHLVILITLDVFLTGPNTVINRSVVTNVHLYLSRRTFFIL